MDIGQVVEVSIGDDRWEFRATANGATEILRNDSILGFVTSHIPQSEQLLNIAFEGIIEDIKKALGKQKYPK